MPSDFLDNLYHLTKINIADHTNKNTRAKIIHSLKKFTLPIISSLLILRELSLRKLPTLVREKAKIILEVFKNHYNTPPCFSRWFLTKKINN